MLIRVIFLFAGLMLPVTHGLSQDAAAPPGDDDREFQQLEKQSREIKAQVLELEAELSALEQDIRYPSNTRWTVFVTASAQADDELGTIDLQVGGRTLASHQYSDEEREALREGGAHRLYIGNLSPGQYSITVRHAGPEEQTLSASSQFVVAKQPGPQLLELKWQPGSGAGGALDHASYADTP